MDQYYCINVGEEEEGGQGRRIGLVGGRGGGGGGGGGIYVLLTENVEAAVVRSPVSWYIDSLQ